MTCNGLAAHLYHMRSALHKPESSTLQALWEYEKGIPSLLSRCLPGSSHYTALLKERVSECHLAQFTTVLKVKQVSKELGEKQEEIAHLRNLALALRSHRNTEEISTAFRALPASYQMHLWWIIWLQKGMPDVKDFGKKALEHNISLLLSTEPLILLIRGNLVEQLLHRVEGEIAVAQQRQVVSLFEQLSDLLYRPLCDPAPILSLVEKLPQEIQLAIHYDIYAYSPARRNEENWGKEELYRNVKALIQLQYPYSSSLNLLEHHLSQQKNILAALLTAKELEELERITVLYRTLSRDKVEKIAQHMSQQVREKLAELERTETSLAFPLFTKRLSTLCYREPLYENFGAHCGEEGTTFCVYAPHAKKVTLLLTAQGIVEHRIGMSLGIRGEWEVVTPYAPHGRTYCYLLEDALGNACYRTDPFSFSLAQGTWGIESRVVEMGRHTWKDGEWIRQRSLSSPTEKPLSIYQVHSDLWKRKEGKPLTYQEMAFHLISYCKEMAITHVLLYGLMDSGGGWGFHVLNYFSPNRRLGSTEECQAFVDRLHQHGIGVLVMWIPAHYKHEPLEVSLHNWDGTNLYSSGVCEWDSHLFDFSQPHVRRFLESSALFWLEKLHCDGISIDAVSHIIQRQGEDYTPGIEFLQELSQTIKARVPGALIIGEETTECAIATEPVEKGGLGLDVVWGIDVGKRMRRLLQTPFEERPYYPEFIHYLTSCDKRPKLIVSHSHDESANRHAEGSYPPSRDNTLYRIQHSSQLVDKFADIRNFFAWQILAPSRGCMIHMGDEIGQRRSWDATTATGHETIEWHLLDPSHNEDYRFHLGLQVYVSDLLRLYRQRPAFWKRGEKGFRLCCHHAENNVLAYERSCPGEKKIYVVHNFSHKAWESYRIYLGEAEHLSTLQGVQQIFHSDHAKYGGKHTPSNPCIRIHREEELYFMTVAISPLSTMLFEEAESISPLS